MNDLLLSEIKSRQFDFLGALQLIEAFIFEESFEENIRETLECSSLAESLLEPLVEYCEQELEDVEDSLAQAEHLINVLFLDLLFIERKPKHWSVDCFKLKNGIEHRTLYPVVKAVILRHIIEQCGFEADLVFVPEKVMLRLICDQQFAIIFDPLNGESLNWEELDQRLDELPAESSQYQMDAMDIKAVLTEYLTALKTSLIADGHYSKALRCVDVLLTLKPDDPFERRDRGFLLHQLDCFKVAYDDYQYFVNQCPQDPAAQILKIQLDNIQISNTILH